MKYLILAVLLSIALPVGAYAQSFYGTTDVETFRNGRDGELRDKKKSPLLKADFDKFAGLNYFGTSDEYRFKAKFTRSSGEIYFLMPTSSGKSVKYIKVGILTFEIEGKKLSLVAYQSEKINTNAEWNKRYGHAFFIPYKDRTNGKETYGGGRYIYMKIPDSENTILDFNLTFNPSCAYGSDRYSCPIPPKANRLAVDIRAGEKIYKYTKSKK